MKEEVKFDYQMKIDAKDVLQVKRLFQKEAVFKANYIETHVLLYCIFDSLCTIDINRYIIKSKNI